LYSFICKHHDSLLSKTFNLQEQPDFCRTLLAKASNRRIVEVSEVINKLKFKTDDKGSSELNTLLRTSFQFRLLRWLHGIGHPRPLRGTHISNDDWDEQRNDTLVRANLMLRAVGETELLPISEFWNLTVDMV
jgi:hypothetical protein